VVDVAFIKMKSNCVLVSLCSEMDIEYHVECHTAKRPEPFGVRRQGKASAVGMEPLCFVIVKYEMKGDFDTLQTQCDL